jgi:hypothetical protein
MPYPLAMLEMYGIYLIQRASLAENPGKTYTLIWEKPWGDVENPPFPIPVQSLCIICVHIN